MKLITNICKELKNQQILFWIFIVMLILPNFLMFFTESTSTLTRICNILLPLGIYWLAMTLNAKPGKMFWWLFFFAFIDAFQIVLLYLYGESPIAVDMFLNVTTTNPTEIDELLSNLLPAVLFVIVIYVSGMVLAVLSIINKDKLKDTFRRAQRKLAGILLLVAFILTATNFFVTKDFRIQDDIFPINGCYNLGLSVKRQSQSLNYAKNSADFDYKATDTRGDSINEIYVLVIGETARADNMGLYGYKRNTTPLLAALGSDLVHYRDAITMSNTTHKSVPLILTSVGSQDDFDGIYCQKGVISAFRQAGFKTAFYSCQRRNHSIIDYLGSEAEDVKFLKDSISLLQQLPDDAMVKTVENKLASYKGGKLLIVLHCYGSHFNYHDRYDKKGAFYTPDNIPSASGKYRDNMVNAYDNSIRETDILLAGVINAIKAKHVAAGLVYVSDHGEDIFDDSRNRFLHASPLPTYYQLRVPFLVWTSSEYQTTFPDKWNQLKAHVNVPISTNRVTFHTLLDMGGVATTYLKPSDAVSNAAFRETPRRYVNDHNEYLPINEAGLKDLDEQQFRQRGLRYP